MTPDSDRAAASDAARVTTVAALTPTGRDGAITARILAAEGFEPVVCPDVHALCAAVSDGAGVLLVAEEALTPAARGQMLATLDAQPSWSDVPVVVLTGEGELSRAIPAGLVAVAARGNVTLLERPVRVATLVTTLRAALRARQRQFDLRDYLAERARAERALRESESRLRDAVLAVPYPMMLHADDGEILQLSRAWSELSGYPSAELPTMRDWTRRAFGERAAEADALVRQDFERAGGPGEVLPSPGEWPIRTASGAELIWDFHSVALGRLPDGRRLILTVALDVTHFKRLLQSEQAARQEAEDANKAKSEFLATMSHELRTPLNAIAGYTQLISLGIRGPVTDPQQVDLQRIDRSQRHLLSLINDILNFAKIEAGHVQIDLKPVRMADVLLGLDAFVSPQLRDKRLRYTDGASSTDAVVLGDEEKVRQILINLLSNAIKFSPPGGEIRVGCTVADGVVRTTVADDGAGIPLEKLDAIFEPFVQVERSFSSTHEGTGLGLSISRELAQRMGGELSVDSELGRGSKFTLTLRRGPGTGGSGTRDQGPGTGDRY